MHGIRNSLSPENLVSSLKLTSVGRYIFRQLRSSANVCNLASTEESDVKVFTPEK